MEKQAKVFDFLHFKMSRLKCKIQLSFMCLCLFSMISLTGYAKLCLLFEFLWYNDADR